MASLRETWAALGKELGAEHYFDNAATTPLDPRVARAMLPWLTQDFANAHSLHSGGRKAMQAVERARVSIAELVDSGDPGEIVFTSGATEANNWVLSSFSEVAASPFEHSSVREPLLAMGGFEAPAIGWRLAPPEDAFGLLSAMLVNNETGAIVEIADWHQFVPERDGRGAAVVHRDLTQAAGRMALHDEPYDLGAFSAHKLYGPKGSGALHMRGVLLDEPFVRGGEQEMGLRGGTVNVPAIVGFGEAAAIAVQEMAEAAHFAQELREIVLEELAPAADKAVNEGARQAAAILSVSFAGIEGETLVIEMDSLGFAVSSGAACSSRSTEPSHVLQALHCPEELIRGTIRISFGKFNTKEAARSLGSSLSRAVDRLRTYQGA